jgi:hypothetical protein
MTAEQLRTANKKTSGAAANLRRPDFLKSFSAKMVSSVNSRGKYSTTGTDESNWPVSSSETDRPLRFTHGGLRH